MQASLKLASNNSSVALSSTRGILSMSCLLRSFSLLDIKFAAICGCFLHSSEVFPHLALQNDHLIQLLLSMPQLLLAKPPKHSDMSIAAMAICLLNDVDILTYTITILNPTCCTFLDLRLFCIDTDQDHRDALIPLLTIVHTVLSVVWCESHICDRTEEDILLFSDIHYLIFVGNNDEFTSTLETCIKKSMY